MDRLYQYSLFQSTTQCSPVQSAQSADTIARVDFEVRQLEDTAREVESGKRDCWGGKAWHKDLGRWWVSVWEMLLEY